ncbi:YbgF trimerization domain-containing protein [Acinetobacter sp. MD2(2019)]|uniref:YbgF trimerization domain-containing protein n=1 Tax=Acinetobacter sp. MD2(2019) TaxID=2605273 RepID=UPI002D1EA778|nr:YbgF trimerization domain-containing protein [Acinetobacter sp. MD2(2019)]MEB3754178.1 tetratricopeptide repeat protein [Acinetobacter sp. MD2(2019)]
MKFKKTALGCIAYMAMNSIWAAPIENVNLSQSNISPNNVSTPTATSTANIPTNLNWELVQKTERLENEVRALRGSLEEQQNSIDQLKKDAENRYNDLDQRIQMLQQKVDPDTDASTDDSQSDSATPATNDASPSNKPANAAPATKTTTAPNTPANPPATGTTAPNNKPANEKQAYTAALDAYKQGGAKSAISPMQSFIKTYPNSVYIGNAHFWLAEFYLAIEPPNYTEAKKNYEIVAKQYPQSAKASRAVYQLYSIAKNIDKNSVSANLYRQQLLAKYPKSQEAGFVKKT